MTTKDSSTVLEHWKQLGTHTKK